MARRIGVTGVKRPHHQRDQGGQDHQKQQDHSRDEQPLRPLQRPAGSVVTGSEPDTYRRALLEPGVQEQEQVREDELHHGQGAGQWEPEQLGSQLIDRHFQGRELRPAQHHHHARS